LTCLIFIGSKDYTTMITAIIWTISLKGMRTI